MGEKLLLKCDQYVYKTLMICNLDWFVRGRNVVVGRRPCSVRLEVLELGGFDPDS